MAAEFGRAGVTESIGGGLIGSLAYQLFLSTTRANRCPCFCYFIAANWNFDVFLMLNLEQLSKNSRQLVNYSSKRIKKLG